MKTEMKILISGGCGFVGHHVVEGLLKNTDWEVVILDSLNYAGDINKISDLNCFAKNRNRISFVYHNLISPISEIKHRQIGLLHYCLHLAAESHVENSLKDALPFAYNVVATTNLLQYLRDWQPNLRQYIGFNTDEVFGPAPKNVFYREIDKFYPSNPYSASKAGQWSMEHAFFKSFKMPILMCHSMNIFGERQHPEKFIPKTVRAILKNQLIPIHGIKGKKISSRCWIHAREVCNALIFLLENGKLGETYNIVGEERSVLDLAEMAYFFIKDTNLPYNQIEWIDYHTTRPGHDLRYALSGKKLAELGWQSSLTFEDSFNKTIDWMTRAENRHWLNL
ncbi:MAG: GDP-mannose 4,6-dehydratase [Candidatus Helarchaeota archaeon]|nr:GDP-mannose 4,6-dehydratase [Candidatus Helarchaeota archaeon]